MKKSECAACGTSSNLHYHHLVPKSLGGSDNETNLLTLCGKCHALAHGVRSQWNLGHLTTVALQYKKTQGQRVGSIPYGFRLDVDGVHLLPDPAEQKVVEAVRAFHAAGLSLRAIASKLKVIGFTNRAGAGFNPKTISSILKDRIAVTQLSHVGAYPHCKDPSQ
jgi:hypothetical protein